MAASSPGHLSYQPPETAGVDCDAMRPLEEHARHLDYLLERLLEPNSQASRLPDPGELNFEWAQVRQWLSMVAGLRYVDVIPVQNNYWGMCERADEYDDAKNYLVSDIATEETRLLYAWGATERLMKMLRLPSLPSRQANRRDYNRASALIDSLPEAQRRLDHYSCVRKHLVRHANGDRDLARDRGLREATELRPWRSEESALLAIGAALRNLPAHGESSYGEPDTWRDEPGPRALPTAAHASRLGCRGLLLTVQQLLSVIGQTHDDSDFEAEEFGWWIKNPSQDWERTEHPTAAHVLRVAHLAPPDDD